MLADVESQLEQHRVELTGYCYRMLGSGFDAEDAVQETMIRAWKGADRFEGRSAVRSWLYRIATNVCFDQLSGSQRRARPIDLGPSSPHTALPADPLSAEHWIFPVPDKKVIDPAEAAVSRESIKLAFVAALQKLPAKQRAALILCEVLAWSAAETAELLETSVASVNSALQRARATLGKEGAVDPQASLDTAQSDLLTRYVEAFEAYDMDALTALLRDDAVLSMPPLELWFKGPQDIRGWMLGTGSICRDSKLIPTVANGAPAFGQYHQGGREPWALITLEISEREITGMTFFLDTGALFPLFGLPPQYPG